MGNLVNTDKVDLFIGEVTKEGKVFLGWKEWVQATHGAWFNAETVNEARDIARTEISLSDNPNVYVALRDWAEHRGLNAYEANTLAGVIWSEIDKETE